MSTYYKAVRPDDGTDFYTGAVQWAPPADHVGEWTVRHPHATEIGDDASAYLSVSTVETDCTGMEWPCRLLTVEAIEDVIAISLFLPNKRAGVAFRVTGERPAHEALGPQGEHVAALIDCVARLTTDELAALRAARNAARNATQHTGHAARNAARNAAMGDAASIIARNAAKNAVHDAVWNAVWGVARNDAEDAAIGLVMRDLLSTEHYDALTRPWRTVVGPIHPGDED